LVLSRSLPVRRFEVERMHRLKFLLAAATVVIVASACSKDPGQAGGPPGGGMPPTMVETAKVEMRSLPNQFETVGTLRADESIVVRPEIAGRIKQIHFAEGQQVAAGSLLFTLDDALTRADLNEANANLQNSKRSYTRAQELAQRQLIAKSDLDTTHAVYTVTEARAASARTRLDKTRIRAPFVGVTGLRNVSVGDYVEAGQELVQLVRLDPIMLDLRAPEVVLSSLAVGQKVEFGVDSFRDERFEATVVAIAPTVDAGGRSVALRARLQNPDQKLRPGMSARVRITLTTNARALLIPEQAIWPSGEQKMVYQVIDGTAKLVPVTLGARHPGLVEITSGLKAGDEIVVAGQLKLSDGAKVTSKPATAPAAADAKPAAATPTAH
jgi:membrane fusion protein (multidrug efflux system)